MRTIKLNVSDSVYSHLMFFLKNLKSDEVKIIEDKKEKTQKEDEIIDFSKFEIKSFKDIKDPVQWQKDLRSEWK